MQTEEQAFEKAYRFLNGITPPGNDAWEMFRLHARYKTLRRREHFLRQDEVCRHLGIITEGYVRHYYLVDGEEVTNDFNFENMITGGYHSFSTGERARFNVVAMEDTTLIIFSYELLLRLYDRFPAWQTLGRLLLERIFNRKQLREESFLLDSAEDRYRKILQTQPEMLQRVPLQYLASYLGVKPETLSRIRARIT